MEKDFRSVVQSWLDGNFDEATKAMIEWSKAMQGVQEGEDEIQVEK